MSDKSSASSGARVRLARALAAGGWSCGPVANLALVVGAGLAVWSGIIHLHLWSAGYRSIPTIGTLFILQGVVGIVLAAALVVVRRVWMAVVVFGFAGSTIGGFLISVYHGLFGFRDTWAATFATQAFALEVTALAVVAAGAALCLWRAPALRRGGSADGGVTPPTPG